MEISVIITNYNYEKYLSRAIRSVVNQTYDTSEYEIIVIDDCSTDGSRKTLELLQGVCKIRTILNETNLGLAASCNKAIQNAMGKYIIRVDSDDYVSRDFLKVHQLFLSHNKTDIHATSSDYFEVDESENIMRRRNGNTFYIACGIMYRSDDMIDIGLFNENIPREDEDFRHRFLKSGRHIYNIPLPLYRYCKHSDNTTYGM